MNQIRSATEVERNAIHVHLEMGRRRTGSDDYLLGFPWEATYWHPMTVTIEVLPKLYLFWDSSAWSGPFVAGRRTLHDGVIAFRQDAQQSPLLWKAHLREIVEKREAIKEPATLYLASTHCDGPYPVIDGNHRAAASYWNWLETGSTESLPHTAWWVSPRMSTYHHYFRNGEDPRSM